MDEPSVWMVASFAGAVRWNVGGGYGGGELGNAMIGRRNGYTPGDHQYQVSTGVTVLLVSRTIMLEMLG